MQASKHEDHVAAQRVLLQRESASPLLKAPHASLLGTHPLMDKGSVHTNAVDELELEQVRAGRQVDDLHPGSITAISVTVAVERHSSSWVGM